MATTDTLAAKELAVSQTDTVSAAGLPNVPEKRGVVPIPAVFYIPAELIHRAEPPESDLPLYRTEFMRDRDRIMYATAFRRLSGKTQIYTVGSDDHRKNRLTHTLEVSQIARTIASAFGFDTNLTEAIALAHDFGHTPFGHAGEQMLHEIMIPESRYVRNSPFYKKSLVEIINVFDREKPDLNKKGITNHMFGFKHNLQSVRICALLEDSYRTNDKNVGLNLTNFTLCGIMLHSKRRYDETSPYPNYQDYFKNNMYLKGSGELAWSFEAYIVRCADDIAQWHHDLEDAIREGVLSMAEIKQTVSEALGSALTRENREMLDSITEDGRNDRSNFAKLSHVVVHTLVEDLINASAKNFEKLSAAINANPAKPTAKDLFLRYDEMKLPMKKDEVIGYSEKVRPDLFKTRIRVYIHHSRNVERMNEKGRYIIRKLFEAYYAHPQQLPDGPIQHIVSMYRSSSTAQNESIGKVRLNFETDMKNPDIYLQSLLMRRICDHIASMTDRYAIDEYNNLYG